VQRRWPTAEALGWSRLGASQRLALGRFARARALRPM
jgi:hypothetical protein